MTIVLIGPPASGKSERKENLVPFTPYYGRTLKALNHSIPDRISDHNPITVDLPLGRTELSQSTSPIR